MSALSAEDVRQAHQAILKHIHVTPVLSSERLDALTDARLHFKCENFQKTGAFKARGALNAVLSLEPGDALKGVATHSSGNHGAALARAAGIRGIHAYIVVPETANQVKKDAIAAYGGEIIECPPTLLDRESTLRRVIEKTGATFVAPYDNEKVIAGQGTAALELLHARPDLDAIVCPIGGGGLISGTSLICAENHVEVYGAEPTGADDAFQSFKSGTRVTEQTPNTISDGLQTTLGEINFDIMMKSVTDVLTVTDEETIDAMKLIFSRMKILVEPSSAVVLAAVLANKDLFRGKQVGLILTGGNVDLSRLPF